MANIRVLALIGFQCFFSLVTSEKGEPFKWILASDFAPEELASLNPQQEHELFLNCSAGKNSSVIKSAFMVEIFSNGIGNDFFEFTSDEKVSSENKAIIRSAFHCFTKLRFQERVLLSLEAALQNAFNFLKETGNIGAAYTKVCSKIDEDLKSETTYSAFMDEIKKQEQRLPKKTYQYGIPKSEEDLRKSFAELANDPQSKKLNAYFVFSFSIRPNEKYDKDERRAILELEKLPGKGEAVQNIFEESTNEMIALVKDISPKEIYIEVPLGVINLVDLRPSFREKFVSKIKEDPNLREDFENILKNIGAD